MKIVLVTWFDVYSLEQWLDKTELKAILADQPRGARTITLGIVHEENNDALILIQSLQPETEETGMNVAGLLLIPKGMIEKVEVLKEDAG